MCDSPPLQPLWSVQPLIWQRLRNLIPILKKLACCCLSHVHWKDTFGPNIKLDVAFSTGREVQLQACQRGCRLCPHLKGYYIDAALSEQLTNLKHLTATTGQSVGYSGALAGGRKALPFFLCIQTKGKCAKHLLFMLQVYCNQEIVKPAGCFELISPLCLTKLLPFVIQAISASWTAQTYLLESRRPLILWLLLLTLNVQTGNKCHCH